jgi:hypothetical protein
MPRFSQAELNNFARFLYAVKINMPYGKRNVRRLIGLHNCKCRAWRFFFEAQRAEHSPRERCLAGTKRTAQGDYIARL